MSRHLVALITGGEEGGGSGSVKARLTSPLLGKPAFSYVLEAVSGLRPERIILALRDAEAVAPLGTPGLGTLSGGNIPVAVLPVKAAGIPGRSGLVPAARAALPKLRPLRSLDVIVIPPDRPLLRSVTLRRLVAAHRRRGCAMTLMPLGPDVERDFVAVIQAASLAAIVRSTSRTTKGAGFLRLADFVLAEGGRVGRCEPPEAWEVLKIARRADLPVAAMLLRGRKNEALVEGGVTMLDPSNTWVDWDAEIGEGTILYPSCVIEGASRIGKGCRVYPHVHIMNSRLADGAVVWSSTVLEGCTLEAETQVGPLARLRPGTVVLAGSRVGNFVEMKNTVFGPRSKAMHLSYLGDSRVEEEVNIGAGTITCNYDGVRKNPTHIGAGAFIGSGTELVAPVNVGRKAYVAAGSTITKDVSPGSLAIARARQVEKPGWAAERSKKMRRSGRGNKA